MKYGIIPIGTIKDRGTRLDPRAYLGKSRLQCEHELKYAGIGLARAKNKFQAAKRNLKRVKDLPEGQVPLMRLVSWE